MLDEGPPRIKIRKMCDGRRRKCDEDGEGERERRENGRERENRREREACDNTS